MTTADHRAILGRLRDEARRHREYADRYAADANRYEVEHYADLYPDRVTVGGGTWRLDPMPGWNVADGLAAAVHIADKRGVPVTVDCNGVDIIMRPGRDVDDAMNEYHTSTARPVPPWARVNPMRTERQ